MGCEILLVFAFGDAGSDMIDALLGLSLPLLSKKKKPLLQITIETTEYRNPQNPLE